MCGIVGYVGKENATPILLNGLAKLEYRGYDSAGIAVRNHKDEPVVVKAEGKLVNLIEKVDKMTISGTVGLGHTRWSTHGAVAYHLDESSGNLNIGKDYPCFSHILYSLLKNKIVTNGGTC